MYLLDTHILLWWLSADERLPMRAREVLDRHSDTVFISAATIWEISIKQSLRKLRVADSFFDDIKRSQFQELAIVFQHAMAVCGLPFLHDDPFDRMLIAQANIEKLILITIDKNILRYNVAVLDI